MGSVVLKLQLTTRIFWLLFPWPFWALLLPSLDMATVMVMAMDMATGDMVTMDTMVRGLLMPSLLLLPSPDMDTLSVHPDLKLVCLTNSNVPTVSAFPFLRFVILGMTVVTDRMRRVATTQENVRMSLRTNEVDANIFAEILRAVQEVICAIVIKDTLSIKWTPC